MSTMCYSKLSPVIGPLPVSARKPPADLKPNGAGRTEDSAAVASMVDNHLVSEADKSAAKVQQCFSPWWHFLAPAARRNPA